MITRLLHRPLVICFLLPLFLLPGRGDVRMPAIFGAHMVLQQDAKLPVWGWAEPGEDVTVAVGTHTAKTKADADGKWHVSLAPFTKATDPLTMTVTGKNVLTFDDVLIGDVWICSGQSNMEFTMGQAHNAATEIPKANDPQLRLFLVAHKIALDPETDVKGEWMACTPDSVRGFTAVGYFFARELRSHLQRPIGLIGTYWGGTPAQAWTSMSGLAKDPLFARNISDHENLVKNYPDAKAKYPQLQADYETQMKQWNATTAPGFNVQMKAWQDQAKQATAANQPPPPRPVANPPMPKMVQLPEGAPGSPASLYNGMIAPLVPYAIKGALWYQGEANANDPMGYRKLFPLMITDWRQKWAQGDFPFLFVQLAKFMAPQVKPSEGGWAGLREAQLMTLSLPATGMAMALDIGDGPNIHPKDKLDVGLRLALVARHVAYGEKLVYSGPIYQSMKVEGNKIRLTFKEVGGGLQMSVPPWTADGKPVPTPTELEGFAIAGADKNFVWAKAQIEGSAIVVSSDQVPAPAAVRYGWASNPPCNLYNKEGLPASPFRTDDWEAAAPVPMPMPRPGPQRVTPGGTNPPVVVPVVSTPSPATPPPAPPPATSPSTPAAIRPATVIPAPVSRPPASTGPANPVPKSNQPD